MTNSDIIIQAEGIGKRYQISAKKGSYRTLRESVMNVPSAAFGALRNGLRRGERGKEFFWALQDVSFSIKRGEVVGIIGCNGAGKSTLLKILSRVTEPTTGYADVMGRVGSLLEVGTGFHPELSGRENIFLNGAILGMRRTEIQRKFDEIVDFSGVERFIETPVKRYSSGMYLRLAFAVAAHLEPEILLVDEVLAVGDAAFQKKCLGKMESVAEEGRTVLFVSHNMGAIRTLCSRGLLLREGEVAQQGEIETIIQSYFADLGLVSSANGKPTERNGNSVIARVSLNGGIGNTVEQSESFELSTVISTKKPFDSFHLYCIVTDMRNQQLIAVRKTGKEMGCERVPVGQHKVAVQFPALWLNPGLYSAYFKLYITDDLDSEKQVSDSFPLDVTGESCPVEAVLHPQVTFTVHPQEKRDLEWQASQCNPTL